MTTELPLSLEAAGLLLLACAVLIFSMNQKYSLIVNRIRNLKDLKIILISPDEKHPLTPRDTGTEISNIELQISHLIHRISMVRFSVMACILAILLLIVHAIMIGVRPETMSSAHYWLTISFLFASFLCIAAAVVLIAIETWKGYRVVRIEVSETSRKK
jgi:hypothetical protein